MPRRRVTGRIGPSRCLAEGDLVTPDMPVAVDQRLPRSLRVIQWYTGDIARHQGRLVCAPEPGVLSPLDLPLARMLPRRPGPRLNEARP